MRKEFRLKKSSDFKRARKEGKGFRSPHFVLYVCKNSLGSGPRLGVSILKRHIKLATRRNKLRRIAQELFRKELAPGLGGCDFVITSRRRFDGREPFDNAAELKKLMEIVRVNL